MTPTNRDASNHPATCQVVGASPSAGGGGSIPPHWPTADASTTNVGRAPDLDAQPGAHSPPNSQPAPAGPAQSATGPRGQSRLVVGLIDLRPAQAFVTLVHRTHVASLGAVFCLEVCDEGGNRRGVAMVGRPVSRHLQSRGFLEVTRVATDGCPNACSALYGAARREARARGATGLVTYTLVWEPGISLRAAGWLLDGVTVVRGVGWANRGGRSAGLRVAKLRWVAPW